MLHGGVGRLDTGLELALLGGSDGVDVVKFAHDGRNRDNVKRCIEGIDSRMKKCSGYQRQRD